MAGKPEVVVQVEGAKQLRKKLTELEDDFGDLKAVHKRIADKAADRARAAVPVRTGKLRASVKGTAAKTTAAVKWGKKSVPYAPIIEFGGYPKGVPFVKGGKHVFPAIRAFGPEAQEEYEREVKRIISRFD